MESRKNIENEYSKGDSNEYNLEKYYTCLFDNTSHVG